MNSTDNHTHSKEPQALTGVIKAVRASEQHFVEDIGVVLNDTLSRKGKVKFSCSKTQAAVESTLSNIQAELNELKESIDAIQKDEMKKDQIIKQQEREKVSLLDFEDEVKELYRSALAETDDAPFTSEKAEDIFSKVRQEIDVLLMSARSKLAHEHRDQLNELGLGEKKQPVIVEAGDLLPDAEENATAVIPPHQDEATQEEIKNEEEKESGVYVEENPTEEITIVSSAERQEKPKAG